MDSVYLTELKKSLTGDPDVRFVFLCNFEVEHAWARNYVGLPRPALESAPATVRRMEELGALLAGAADVLCLSQPLDTGFRAYAEGLGFGLPAELVVDGRPDHGTSERVLADPGALRRLAGLADGRTYLMPMGTSAAEQKIAEATGLPLAVPDNDTAERVNGKIYGRRIVDQLGIRPVPGTCCETVESVATAVESRLGRGIPVIVKESYGVSGKGLIVVDTGKKADRLLRMLRQRAARTGSDTVHVVVEEFLAKKFDLNYQFTIDRAGAVRFDFVKEALTAGGVHQGHVMPPALGERHLDELREAALRIGGRLYADGFFGVVGVDAILGADDTLYPALEINARLNMSSYQGPATERFQRPDGAALAKHYPVRLAEPLGFADLTGALGGLLDDVLITCFGTVNAEASRTPPFEGRLYTLLFAPDRAGLAALDERVSAALATITVGGR